MRYGRLSKKNKNLQPDDSEEFGDYWTYTGFKRESGLMISFSTGKRVEETCKLMLTDFFERMELPLPSNRISIFTDGNCQYSTVIQDLYCESCIEYGQVIKLKEQNRLVCLIRESIFGNPEIDSISTSLIEGYNNKIRQRLSRFSRKTASFSKRVFGYVAAMNIFQFVQNFIDLKKDSQTPAMLESITDHRWNWKEFLSHHLQL
jgi:IS1 family transposase